MKKAAQEITCPKCNGRGHIDRFGHVAQGKCFQCAGHGTIVFTAGAAKSGQATSKIATKYAAVYHDGQHDMVCGESNDLAYLAGKVMRLRSEWPDTEYRIRHVEHGSLGRLVTRSEVAKVMS